MLFSCTPAELQVAGGPECRDVMYACRGRTNASCVHVPFIQRGQGPLHEIDLHQINNGLLILFFSPPTLLLSCVFPRFFAGPIRVTGCLGLCLPWHHHHDRGRHLQRIPQDAGEKQRPQINQITPFDSFTEYGVFSFKSPLRTISFSCKWY